MAAESDIIIPLETFLALLRANGFKDISTTAILDIQKILANLDEKEIKNFRKLKSFLSPVICRNKEDQGKFSQVFDQYAMAVEQQTKSRGRIINHRKRSALLWRIAIALFVVTLIAFLVWWITPKPHKPYLSLTKSTYWPVGKYAEDAVGDSIGYEAYLNDTLPGKKYMTDWVIGDTVYTNSRAVRKVYSNTGYYRPTVHVKDEKGDTIVSDSLPATIVIEHPPYVSIHSQIKSDRKIYTPLVSDPSDKTNRYRFKWYINDSLASREKDFSTTYYSNKPYEIKLVIDSRGLYHSKNFDSLTASLREMPQYSLAAKAVSPLQSSSVFMGSNLLWMVFSLLLLPLAAAIVIFRLWKKPTASVADSKPRMPVPPREEKNSDENIEGPLFIDFKKQDHKISPQEQISRLADGLRKRQLSDIYKLHLGKTIHKTILAGGFPSFEFTPKTKPVEFLVMIDKEHSEAHLIKLFEYLVERLRSEEVNITAYDYYKEPLYLNNPKFNHIRIPLDRVAQLYPDTVLFLFTTGEYFFEPLKSQLKPWVEEKFREWENRIIITPVPRKDWTYKESILQQSGFVIIPADLYQDNLLKILLDFVNLQIDTTKKSNVEIPQAYSARYFNFQQFDAVKKYLDDPELINWVSATAVYPSVDWKVTVAIGKELEEHAKSYTLVTYENLLKISRIGWMQDGIIDDTLRLDMLRYIDNTTEAIARKTVIGLLEEIKEQFTEQSFAKEEFDLHNNSNRLLLHAYDKSNPVSDETVAAVKEYVSKGYLDWPQTVYYQEAQNTLLKTENSTAPVPMEEYLRILDAGNAIKKELEDKELKEKEKNSKWLRNLSATGALLLLSFTAGWLLNRNGLLRLTKVLPSGMNVLLSVAEQLKQPGDLTLSIKIDTSSIEALKENDSTFVFNALPAHNKGTQGTLVLATTDGNPLYASIPLDSNYRLSFIEPERTPLSIRYNDLSRKPDLTSLMDALSANFNIDTSFLSFTDSSRVDFYSDSQRQKATLIAAVVNQTLRKKISIKEDYGTVNAAPVLFLNLRSKPKLACEELSAVDLPVVLEDMWLFNSNIISFNRKSKVMYLSDNQSGRTYNNYSFQEICLDSNNVYKIKMKTTIGAIMPLGIRNISSSGISVAICGFAGDKNTKAFAREADGQHIQQAACDNFTSIKPYYEQDPDKIFLPANPQQKQEENELKKFRLKADSVISSAYSVQVYLNTFTGTGKNYATLVRRAFASIGFKNAVIIITNSYFAGTPFQRNYFTLTGNKRVVPTTRYKSLFGNSKSSAVPYKRGDTIPNNRPIAPVPDCNRTFYSLKEAQSVDARVICTLDLSKENLTAIPREVFLYINLRELSLGSTNIPEESIKQLQAALPKCAIKYTRQSSLHNTDKEVNLGTILVDKKGYPESKSLQLISDIATRLKASSGARIRLEATYNSTSGQKDITRFIRTIKNLFYKDGVDQKLQPIDDLVTEMQAQQQQQQQQKQQPDKMTSDLIGVNVVGINLPAVSENKSKY